MAFPARPDHWQDLSDLGAPGDDGIDAGAALLRVNAEMFVNAPARDREIIETFETLALGFLPMVDRATLVDIARILAPCEDTPATVLDHLSRHSPEARRIVLERSARLPSLLDRDLLGTRAGRLQLAARSALDSSLVERLLVLREREVEDVLAANPTLAPYEPPFAEIVRRAQDRPALAAILLSRTDLTLEHEAALYLLAPRERRMRIKDGIAAGMESQRVQLIFRLTEHDLCELLTASREGDVQRLEALMSAAFGFPAATEWRCLQIGRHELLALALKALGLADRDAARIFLSLHPALSHSLSAVKELVRAVRDVPSPVALVLVESILGAKALSGCGASLEDARERQALAALACRGYPPDAA
ncbi:MAG TPA: hypothetical protein VEZ16_15315 [Microvirga sp.]|nr:hypothetical protein [Microvirga sp.]